MLVSTQYADRITSPPLVLLYGGNRQVERAYSSTPTSQCHNCWKFGHVKPRCKEPVVCPLCAGAHPKADHRCSNPSCPKGGNLKPVLNCCVASPAHCPNCEENHSARYRDCPARPAPPPGKGLPAPQGDASQDEQPRNPDAMEVQQDDSDSTRPSPPVSRPSTPPRLMPPLDLTTPRPSKRSEAPGPSRSASRTGRPFPDEGPSPSPAPQVSSATRR